jgi:hypothetical protein
MTAADTERLHKFIGLFMHAMTRNGEWDDGCFYYNKYAAPELGQLIEQARAIQEAFDKARKP